jgi:hypothetical protein
MTTLFLLLAALAAPGSAEEVTLLNGKDLEGWVAEGTSQYVQDGRTRPVWTVRDGKLVCTGKGFGFLRYTRREFADFQLHVEFRMAPGSNSGLGIRTRPFDPSQSRATRPSFYSYEIQLCDDSGKPPSNRSSGSLYRYVAPTKNAIRAAGEWNTIEVECRGPSIRVTLNGQRIIDVDQGTVEALRRKPLKGFLCLQNHGSNVEFAAIRVKELETGQGVPRP